MSLFRTEVLENKRPKLYGELLIPSNVQYLSIAGLILVCLFGIVLFGVFGTFTRSEQALGHVIPSKGVIKIKPLRAGTLSSFNVRSGTLVAKGDRLFTIASELTNAQDISLQASGIETLNRQIALRTDQLRLEKEKTLAQEESLAAQKEAILASRTALKHRLEIQVEIVGSLNKVYTDTKGLIEKGHISRSESERRKQAYLSALKQESEIKQAISEANLKLKNLSTSRQEGRLEYEAKVSSINAEILVLRQQALKLESDRTYSVQAPTGGMVTALLLAEGEAVQAQETVLSLLPTDSVLQAELFIPSKATGFISEGQDVRLTFDAFPYEQFGSFSAKIVSVTQTVLLPEEAKGGFEFKEPMYRVITTLDKDIKLPLRPGMRLEATIILGKQAIFEWLLKPIKVLRADA